MAIVAIFGQPVLQGLQVLAQAVHLLIVVLEQGFLLCQQRLLVRNEFVSLRQLFSQHLIFFSQSGQFFFNRHGLTLLALTSFGKSPADLASYQATSYSNHTCVFPFAFIRLEQRFEAKI